jgi:hypothetical protein
LLSVSDSIDFRHESLTVPEQEAGVQPKYITLTRLALEYGISKGKAHRMIKDGRIDVVRVVDKGRSRGKILVLAASVDRYLKSLEVAEWRLPLGQKKAGGSLRTITRQQHLITQPK